MRKKGVFLEYSIEIALIGREGGNILSVKQNLAFVRGLKSADGPSSVMNSFSRM